MAHNLEILDNGQASMAYAGEVPWHGLGVAVPPDLSPNQMLEAAGLDWKVETKPCYTKIGNKQVDINRQALVRDSDGKILDIISNNWKPVQNETAFDFFNEFVEAGDMEMNTAGSLAGGRTVWALAKVKESFELFRGKDVVESHLLFTNPHVYGQTIFIQFTPIRVVCQNTLALSLKTKTEHMLRLHHRHEFDPEAAKEALGLAHNKLKDYKERASFLAKKKMKDEDIVEYFTRIFPITGSNKREKEMSRNATYAIEEAFENQPGAELGRGTFWHGFNTVTFMADHILGRSADTRLQSAWYGTNRNLKTHAMEVALEMAEKA